MHTLVGWPNTDPFFLLAFRPPLVSFLLTHARCHFFFLTGSPRLHRRPNRYHTTRGRRRECRLATPPSSSRHLRWFAIPRPTITLIPLLRRW
jgi:hypothetical protein